MQGISSKALSKPENKFKYNGKELEHQEFSDGSGLEEYDYGARMYDAQLGRFQSADPDAKLYFDLSPYTFVRNNPILRVDPTGKWDITVHVYHNREQYGYGYAVVTDRNGNEVFRFKVRVEGVGGRDRMRENSDTPLGTYDIPKKGEWLNTKSRISYGPNYRLVLNGQSGEIKESHRNWIRVHGGRQERYDEQTHTYSAIPNATLKKTHGCIRAFDADMNELKKVTDGLEKDDPNETPGTLEVKDDLVKDNDGNYVIPNSEGEQENKNNNNDDEESNPLKAALKKLLQKGEDFLKELNKYLSKHSDDKDAQTQRAKLQNDLYWQN